LTFSDDSNGDIQAYLLNEERTLIQSMSWVTGSTSGVIDQTVGSNKKIIYIYIYIHTHTHYYL